jgi:hypothetical protein
MFGKIVARTTVDELITARRHLLHRGTPVGLATGHKSLVTLIETPGTAGDFSLDLTDWG